MLYLLKNRITIVLIFSIFVFISCSKDSDEPNPAEITVTTSDFSITMDENPTNDQVIGTVSATTNEGSVSFSVTEQNPSGAFSIDTASGELKVADATLFEFETNPTITGTVKVSNGAVFKNAIIIITLNNIGNTYEGDLILKTQEEVNLFGANQYTKITGSLIIGDPEEGATTNIFDLYPLQSLKTISDDFWIINNPNLISTLGLSLNHVGGKLAITVNSSLEKVEGLNNITSVLELALTLNDVLDDLSGLTQLISIEDKITLVSCPQIPNLDWLSNLTSFGGDLTIRNCNSLTNIDGLSNLTTVNGEYNYFRITYNNSLTNLDGIGNLNTDIYLLEVAENSSLTSIAGLQNKNMTTTLIITGNPVLENLYGLESTTNISHEITISYNISLIDIQGLSNLQSAESIRFFNNEILPNLNGLNNLISGRELDLRGNLELTDFCALRNFFTVAPPPVYYVQNNAYNPTKQDIIDGNCSL